MDQTVFVLILRCLAAQIGCIGWQFLTRLAGVTIRYLKRGSSGWGFLVRFFMLHRVGTLQLKNLDRMWLRDLPASIPRAINPETACRTVFGDGENSWTDDTRSYPLQWCIIATTDAYPHGTFGQRVAACKWLERALDSELTDATIGEASRPQWLAAELLIALRLLSASEPDRGM